MFIRYMSHELRTPLNSAYMGLQILRQEIRSGVRVTIDDVQTLAQVYDSTELTMTILNNMLTSDSIESGTLVVTKRDVGFQEFVKETLQPFILEVDCNN